MFTKLLIANRGEIAVRVIKSARALGYQTVAVASDADEFALHAELADEVVHIGGVTAAESYLAINKIISAAKDSGADAIHPGYGFLSENADFAAACEEAEIAFIGPPIEAIQLMGNKRLAKLAMLAADVPCIPGYEGEDQSAACLRDEAQRIGFPVMIKASAGGGGRGMRLVQSSDEMQAAIETARSEAINAFGDGDLILEKAVIAPRHIEIQVFADSFGNVVYLGERDCSIQRRHQKVVEEAPSPFVSAELRKAMGEAAVKATRVCEYVGAGTVEFLVDREENFYFLEMNTRLQVEHPVTELVTGTDLVAWQLKVASGEALPVSQDEIRLNGHAIEVRLYAEDPANGFMPQTGLVHQWRVPDLEGVRVDHGVKIGNLVSPYYDPMLAKIITYGETREEARRRLALAVDQVRIHGVKTNKAFLGSILAHPNFAAGDATTAFIESYQADLNMGAMEPDIRSLALAAALFNATLNAAESNAESSASKKYSAWTNNAALPQSMMLGFGDLRYSINITALKSRLGNSFSVQRKDEQLDLTLVELDNHHCVFRIGSLQQSCGYLKVDNTLYLDLQGTSFQFENLTHADIHSGEDATGSGEVRSSMEGLVVAIPVEVNQVVGQGETVAVVEAMKMQHQITAAVSGVVDAVAVKAGEQVKNRQVLLNIVAADEKGAE